MGLNSALAPSNATKESKILQSNADCELDALLFDEFLNLVTKFTNTHTHTPLSRVLAKISAADRFNTMARQGMSFFFQWWLCCRCKYGMTTISFRSPLHFYYSMYLCCE